MHCWTTLLTPSCLEYFNEAEWLMISNVFAGWTQKEWLPTICLEVLSSVGRQTFCNPTGVSELWKAKGVHVSLIFSQRCFWKQARSITVGTVVSSPLESPLTDSSVSMTTSPLSANHWTPWLFTHQDWIINYNNRERTSFKWTMTHT